MEHLKKYIIIFSIPFLFCCIGLYFLAIKSSHQGKKESLVLTTKPTIEVLFSPDNNIRSKIIEAISKETKAIWCAAFRLTDKPIAAALLEAYKRGVQLIFVIDKDGLSGMSSKLLYFFSIGIPVYIFPPINENALLETKKPKRIKRCKDNDNNFSKFGNANALMHNKFIILHGQKIIITGSYNFTKSAQEYNQENCLFIINVNHIFEAYIKQFEILCKRSTLLAQEKVTKKINLLNETF